MRHRQERGSGRRGHDGGSRTLKIIVTTVILAVLAGIVVLYGGATSPSGGRKGTAPHQTDLDMQAVAPPSDEHEGLTPSAGPSPGEKPDAETERAARERDEEYARALADRRRAFFDAVVADYEANRDKPNARDSFISAQVLFHLGRDGDALRMIDVGLDQINEKSKHVYGGNCGFIMWPGIECYVRWEAGLDEARKARFKDKYTHAVWYSRGRTSNHVVMGSVTRYLATEAWGEEAFSPGEEYLAHARKGGASEDEVQSLVRGNKWRDHDPSARKFILDLLRRMVRDGPGEYASRPYGSQNVLPILGLAELAKDEEIRHMARIAFEVHLAQLAPAFLHGHLGTWATRSYPDMLSQSATGSALFMWLYFGGVRPGNLFPRYTAGAAVADFRPPPALVPAGTDRSEPYVHRSLMNGWCMYSYVNKSYVLFSRYARRPHWVGQQYPCGVMWDESDLTRRSFLWLTCPNHDSTPVGDHTHGCTTYEEIVQHEGVSLYVYRMEDERGKARHPYVLSYVPGGHRAIINEGATDDRVFLHYGSVLIAITASEPFEWDPSAGIRHQADRPSEGDSEFRVMATRAAVALETASPGDFPGADAAASLAAFRRAIVGKTRLSLSGDASPTAVYTDRLGNTLKRTYGGESEINGEMVDYGEWPGIENPWMRQVYGGPLAVTDGRIVREYDFKRWEVSERKGRIEKPAPKPFDGFPEGRVDVSLLPDLVLWLDASDLQPGPLETWPDRSGAGNDATVIANDNVTLAPPTVVAAAMNGKPAVRFSDSLARDALPKGVQPGTALSTPEVVVRSRTIEAFMVVNSDERRSGTILAYAGMAYNRNRIFLAQVNRGNPRSSIMFGTPSGEDRQDLSAKADGVLENSRPAVIRMSMDKRGVSALAVNGREVASVTQEGWVAHMNRPFLVGTDSDYRYHGYSVFNGDVAEVVVCTRGLSPEVRRQVEEHLARKWGIALEGRGR